MPIQYLNSSLGLWPLGPHKNSRPVINMHTAQLQNIEIWKKTRGQTREVVVFTHCISVEMTVTFFESTTSITPNYIPVAILVNCCFCLYAQAHALTKVCARLGGYTMMWYIFSFIKLQIQSVKHSAKARAPGWCIYLFIDSLKYLIYI